MPKLLDLTGQTFGRLTALARKAGPNAEWVCRCECGTISSVRIGNLRNGHTKSCGCLAKEVSSKAFLETFSRHGHAKHGQVSSTYKSWRSMIERCSSLCVNGSERYIGLGIKVYERWERFENFLEDMGERPEGKTLDRINPSGNYEPGNCRWATPKEQARNRKSNFVLSYRGETRLLIEWSEQLGLSSSLIRWRLKHGWSVEKALLTPARPKLPDGKGRRPALKQAA